MIRLNIENDFLIGFGSEDDRLIGFASEDVLIVLIK